jgi:hypothetical protein
MGSRMLRGVSPEPIRFAQGKLHEWAQHDTTGFARSSSLSAPIIAVTYNVGAD